jgi:hypothetical protein
MVGGNRARARITTPTYVQDLRVRFIVVVLLFASIASSASMLFLLLRGCCFFSCLDSYTEDMQPGLLHGTSVACFGLNAFLHRELASCIEFVVFLAGKGATVRHSQLHDLTIA